jgi:hypothetical protein
MGGNFGDMLLGGVTAGRIEGRVKDMSKREKGLLLKLIIELIFDDDDEESDDQDDKEEEAEEEDDE